jgi:hypothetical protein
MIWPVAALAIGLLAFVIAYGSVLQGRLASSARPVGDRPTPDEPADATS